MKQIIVKLPKDVREKIATAIKTDGRVKVTGLGIFEVRSIKGRPGRNPLTGAITRIPDYKKLAFRPTAFLKRIVRD